MECDKMKHIIKLTDKMWDRMKHACYSGDIFEAWGIWDKMIDRIIESYKQIEMNPDMYNKIQNLLSENIKDTLNIKYCNDPSVKKQLRYTSPKSRQSLVLFDWMNCSPKSNDNVPIDEIWWYDKEEK
jgi:hypothetical protein